MNFFSSLRYSVCR